MPYSEKAHRLFEAALHDAKIRKERGLKLSFVSKAVHEGIKKPKKKRKK
jgi:hypothetical protein